mgnify:CR=1 FL=1
MRIIGGTYRGKKLLSPANDRIRPTTDRMRETLFNILEHGSGRRIKNSTVLDLFAGSGALGIEAISRGALHVSFIDHDIKLITQNLDLLKNAENFRCLKQDLTKFKGLDEKFDIIFIDPPYHKGMIENLLKNLHEFEMISINGIVVIEYSSNEKISLPSNFHEIKTRKMGEATFSILEYLA